MKRSFTNKISLLAVCLFGAITAKGQTDSLSFSLDSAVVRFQQNTSRVSGSADAGYLVDASLLGTLPQLAGSADPLHYAQFFPGVQTNSEGDNGIRINGCDNAHNIVSVDGIPVYGTLHLLGLFSVFNTDHFSGMQMNYSSKTDARLGGAITMTVPRKVVPKAETSIAVGLLSSQATTRAPVGKKSMVSASLRTSYINLLYSDYLVFDNSRLKYNFWDADLSWLTQIDSDDQIRFEFYSGVDDGSLINAASKLDLYPIWGNLLAGLTWEHGQLSQKLYLTRSESWFNFNQSTFLAKSKDIIETAGYKAGYCLPGWAFSLDAMLHEILPQSLYVESYGEKNEWGQKTERAFESVLSAEKKFDLSDYFSASILLKGHAFKHFEQNMDLAASPALEFGWNLYTRGRLKLCFDVQHQYLFQTGISQAGLPFQLWMAAGDGLGPQVSYGTDLSYSLEALHGMLSVSADIYYKYLQNQMEYTGSLYDIISGSYDFTKMLVMGDGFNYGLNLMVQKRAGDLTGWISASAGRSMRHFDHGPYVGTFPSSHERLFELNGVGSYHIGDIEIGAAAVFASGTPFTAPESLYISAGQIIANYGAYNGCRLPPYVRLDVSVSYRGLNFSLYNALGNRNSLMYYLQVDPDSSGFQLASYDTPIRFLPSLSYKIKF